MTTGTLARWCIAVGAMCVVAGGLVAAVTDPLSWGKGSWVAAYLVLVCGVPLYVVGRVLTSPSVGRTGWCIFALWNVGNAAVIVGTLLGSPYVVDGGGALVLLVLLALLRALLRSRPAQVRSGSAQISALNRGVWRGLAIAFLIALIVSVPIGLVLAHLRAD